MAAPHSPAPLANSGGGRTWPQLAATLLHGDELSSAETAWAMGEIMAGAATAVQIATFAVALRAKGETPGEIAGLVEAMLANATLVDLPDEVRADALDVVGTGGDRAHTVNISTMAALVAAGAGVRVVKHGNRAASSACGAADLLEYLGVPLDLPAASVARCVDEVGIGFCFAASFHPGMRHASVVRREMGVPTFFNFLGPLTNPAQPQAGLVGCADPRMAPVMAEVFAARGNSVLLVRGEDGLDEATTAAPTRVWVISDGTVAETVVDPLDLGIPRSQEGDLRGADAPYNAEVTRKLLAGETGPVRDAVVLNAGAALAAHAGPGSDLLGAWRAGIERANAAIDSGAAAAALDRWVTLAASLRPGG
ncbi:anthranilate phosphoribosyltransferase [Rugosimonospora acidiphila]|uniref:Anthranilate phosphoribosyltransferase n=1 Tax=Rugosimonospora acidiphila TaxID=556531 RepID=A0ABP9RQW8_9ACTN